MPNTGVFHPSQVLSSSRWSFVILLLIIWFYSFIKFKQELRIGSMSGALMRVLPSHQCASGSNPGPSVTAYGLSLLVVLVIASGVFVQKLLLYLLPKL